MDTRRQQKVGECSRNSSKSSKSVSEDSDSELDKTTDSSCTKVSNTTVANPVETVEQGDLCKSHYLLVTN
ncbi:unnamed protein product [Schistosoma margrebowiei]|uniref:Uncharacterized protein n=1 Tax=Schistosoma margrebowiei TaxID=48269 RepID=A0A3P8EE29_9TREM|nr:unnamed protein product [Schistosoma margrebowiei]